MFIFANAKDKEGKLHYFVADDYGDILNHCWKEDPRDDLEILGYPENVTPFMAIHHYEWVGAGKRPAQLQESKPFNYRDPSWTPPEKW